MAHEIMDALGYIKNGALFAVEYKNKAFAIAEVIDNAIDSKARNIGIIIRTKNTEYKEVVELYVLNDGKPLDNLQLVQALQLGKTAGDEKTIGKFGVGFKQAIFSMCKSIDFISINDLGNSSAIKAKFDTIEMLKNNTAMISDAEDIDYNHEFKDVPNFHNMIKKMRYSNPEMNNVTVVRAYNFNDGISKSDLVNDLQENIGNIFRYHLTSGSKSAMNISNSEKVNIFYQLDNESEGIEEFYPKDPLFLMKDDKFLYNTRNYEKYDIHYDFNSKSFSNVFESVQLKCLSNIFEEIRIDNEYYYEKNVSVKDNLNGSYVDAKFRVKCSLVKEDWFVNCKGAAPGRTILGEEMGRRSDGKNFRFVRNGREIDSGNYRFPKFRTEDRFWGIEIHFSDEMDSVFNLTSNKQKIDFTVSTLTANTDVRKDIRLYLEEVRKELRRKYDYLNKMRKLKIKLAAEKASNSKPHSPSPKPEETEDVNNVSVSPSVPRESLSGNPLGSKKNNEQRISLSIGEDYSKLLISLNNQYNIKEKQIRFKKILNYSKIDNKKNVVSAIVTDYRLKKEKYIVGLLDEDKLYAILLKSTRRSFELIKNILSET